MGLATIAQVALPVASADRSEHFYSEQLGLPKLYRFGDLVFFDCGQVRLMLEQSEKEVIPAAGVCHYFRVADIDQSVAELTAKEVKFISEPHLIARMPDHELWMTFFNDPDQHQLALMEERR